MIIHVENVSRSFRSVKRSENEKGVKGALKFLLKPEFQTYQALKNINFSIEPGSFTGLIGANGAGKTTLLKILSGLIAPTSGKAQVLGYRPFDRTIDFRKRIALVMGQKAQLWWDLPAHDAFDLLQAIYDIPMKVYQDRVHFLAELLDVKDHLYTQIRRLSLGERMKMELIGALIHWPEVIFLDEPTIGLDVVAASKLREFLKVFNQKERATIILTSHNMDDIERLCSRVLILRSGEMIYDGKPQGLVSQGECRLKLKFVTLPELSKLQSLTGIDQSKIQVQDEDGSEEKVVFISLNYEKIVHVLGSIMNSFQVHSMGIEQQSLENVIHHLYLEEKK